MDEDIFIESKHKYIELIPFFDLHFGSQECDEKLIERGINLIRNKKHAYTFLGGDLIECSIYGGVGAVHQQKIQVDEQVEKIVKMLRPIRSKILFSIYGNHEQRIEKSTGLNLSKILADQLNIPFLGWESHFSINIKNKQCRIYAHHGTGSALTSGSKLNSIEKLHFRSPFANLIICGHLHAPLSSEKEIRFLDRKGILKNFTQYFVMCGSCHLSDGYATTKAFNPIPPSLTSIKVEPINDDFKVDIRRLKSE